MSALHPFDVAMSLAYLGQDHFGARDSPAYRNMVGPFGGVTAALLLRATLLHPRRLGDPIALTINYAAAISEGPFVITARPIRTNRSTQHWVLELQQDGQIAITGTALLGLRRDTWSASECPAPRVAEPARVARSTPPGREPVFDRYEMRFVDGAFPTEWHGLDTGSSRTLLWCRDDPPRPLDFPSLAALADVAFPRIWRRRPKQVPMGTLSMTVYFHAEEPVLRATGSSHLLVRLQAHAFLNGFSDQTSHLWNEKGDLLATTHQSVYYRE